MRLPSEMGLASGCRLSFASLREIFCWFSLQPLIGDTTLKSEPEAEIERSKRVVFPRRRVNAVIDPNGTYRQVVPQTHSNAGTEIIEGRISQASGIEKHSADDAGVDGEIVFHIKNRAGQSS